jgi:hypothetical protein
LQFCSTRKSTQQAGETLAKDSRGTMIKSKQQRQKLLKYANMIKDNKLRGMIYFIVLFFYYFFLSNLT